MALRRGTMMCIVDEHANTMAEANAVTIIADIKESDTLVAPSVTTDGIVDYIPLLANRNVVAPPDCHGILKAFGIDRVVTYPVIVATDPVTGDVTVPCVSESVDGDGSWEDVSISGGGYISDKLKDLNYCAIWIPRYPQMNPVLLQELVSKASVLHDYVVLIGQSAVQLDLYLDQEYDIDDNCILIDLIGRVGRWDEVIRVIWYSDTFISPYSFLAKIATFAGNNVAIIGPCPYDECISIGGACINAFNCRECPYEFCPGMSPIVVDVCGDGLVIAKEGES